ncbi:conserved membrane protein of unknown function [Burkholderia multivorans]
MQQKYEQAVAVLAALTPTNRIHWPAALLGVVATATAVALSILSGWQRGGLMTERAVWIAISVVIVVAAHLLPAFCKPFGWRVRTAGALIWIACLAATCYGHATFVMLSQRHAGDARAATVPAVIVTARGVTEIAADRAKVIEKIARVTARNCRDRCAIQRAEQRALSARLDALTVEEGEARRQQAAADRADAARTSASADPMSSEFGALSAGVQLATAVAFAAILEAVGSFCWFLAVRPGRKPVQQARVVPFPVDATPVTMPAIAGHESPITVTSHAPAARACMERKPAVDDVTETAFDRAAAAATVAAEIAAGRLRGTVAEIREYLRCSQTRAREVRHLAISIASSN